MSTREKRNTATRTAILVVFGLAVLVGGSWLLGVQKQNTLLLGSHPREAFAAVKRAAGPRMQVRRIDISTNEMSVLAWDPDMPDQRWLSNNQRRSGPGHWYSGQGVKEQSWRVAYWTIFGRDWYRVTGPIVEGIIQEQEGPAFDLRPEDFLELAELRRKAAPDPAIPSDACPLRLIADARLWTICERGDDPVLVSMRAIVPSRERPPCAEAPPPLMSSGSGLDERMFSRLFGCERVN
jgi:hypothetical protein